MSLVEQAFRCVALHLVIIGLTTAGCTSARFAPPPAATVRSPEPIRQPLGGPYTRQREDEEFGQSR
jgi:hypothetical protein